MILNKLMTIPDNTARQRLLLASGFSCLLLLLAVFAGVSVYACEVQDAREIKMGVDKGFKGRCSNNGKVITCTHDKNKPSWSCQGPKGRYNAAGRELKQTLIVETCGCFTETL